MRIDDPWYDALASGWGEEHHGSTALAPRQPGDGSGSPGTGADGGVDAHAAAYLAVHRSAAFQEVRRRHRRFVLPVGAAFLLWYLTYVTAATAVPHLMGRPVGDGPLTVGMLAALAQFAAVFLLAGAYARHARLRRDRVALELRWHTQDMARTAAAGEREDAVR